jgi:hypothetical protein
MRSIMHAAVRNGDQKQFARRLGQSRRMRERTAFDNERSLRHQSLLVGRGRNGLEIEAMWPRIGDRDRIVET